MVKKKGESYIDFELLWLEKKAQEIKDYCDAKKIPEITDREVGRKIAATIEQQIKSIRDSLMDYVKIIEAIDKLREKDSVKKTSVRGDQQLTPMEKGEI